jgi:hypothetical protein
MADDNSFTDADYLASTRDSLKLIKETLRQLSLTVDAMAVSARLAMQNSGTFDEGILIEHKKILGRLAILADSAHECVDHVIADGVD